ncbi:unnamed protein product [Prunus armeniaca]|uniref:Uncharacterized protein n=1 Tax=Prunus armeniaca TaxID=36596 RepID=A0A6J5U726_PRUAR|nr:unnamed protein product [Prunus armeniaca]CAB4286183.1 unnamed protein product [Prunus armeniaca]
MPRAAQRVVSTRARSLLADRKGQDPNLTSQGVSVHLRSRQDAFDRVETAVEAAIPCLLEEISFT